MLVTCNVNRAFFRVPLSTDSKRSAAFKKAETARVARLKKARKSVGDAFREADKALKLFLAEELRGAGELVDEIAADTPASATVTDSSSDEE